MEDVPSEWEGGRNLGIVSVSQLVVLKHTELVVRAAISSELVQLPEGLVLI